MLISMIRTVILYAIIIFALRIMGKRQISQMQISELVVTLLLSELAVLPIQNYKEPIMNGIAPMIVLVIFEVLIAIIMMKSDKFRQLLCGKPIVVIKKGEIVQRNMKRLRMTTEELSEHLRQNGAFALSEVEYAIIETNGLMSVMKKTEYEPITPEVLHTPVSQNPIEIIIVTDGVLAKSSLQLCGLSEEWVYETLAENLVGIKEVFVMTADEQGRYRIIKKDNSK